MRIASLELVSPVALATCQRPPQHLRRASAGPVAVIASLAVCFGVGYVGLPGVLLAATTLVALCLAATRSRYVQRRLDRRAVQRGRARHEFVRRSALFRATPARQVQYVELRELVEGIERSDPVEAARLELQELLDHYVQLAVGHQRCLESLRVAGGAESQASTPIPGTPPTKRRRDLAARRLRHREETTARLEAIADEIGCTDDLIRLVAQRTACADLDTLIDGEREIGRRLGELDEVDAELAQVSA